MAKYLLSKNNHWYYRRRVPKSAKERLGSSDLIQVLPSCSYAQALKFARRLSVCFDWVISTGLQTISRLELCSLFKRELSESEYRSYERQAGLKGAQKELEPAAVSIEVKPSTTRNAIQLQPAPDGLSVASACNQYIKEHVDAGLWREDAQCEAANSLEVFQVFVGEQSLAGVEKRQVASFLDFETVRVICPDFADVFEWREAL